jgi:probable rRNA maturation factor
MTIDLDLQNASGFSPVPRREQFARWVEAALEDRKEGSLSVRLVDEDESSALNDRYRGKQGPTNVLAFAADLPQEVGLPLLGDIVICAPLVATEAERQGKTVEDHWAHLTIHGVLHLLGHDHQEAEAAERMETLEKKLLAGLGVDDPYA